MRERKEKRMICGLGWAGLGLWVCRLVWGGFAIGLGFPNVPLIYNIIYIYIRFGLIRLLTQRFSFGLVFGLVLVKTIIKSYLLKQCSIFF